VAPRVSTKSQQVLCQEEFQSCLPDSVWCKSTGGGDVQDFSLLIIHLIDFTGCSSQKCQISKLDTI